jgi:ATP-dependent Clp protease ATP-binding subunit ClpB
LAKRLEDRNITLNVDEKACEWLGQKGYDPAYGAWPLKRVIQKHLENVFATMVLNGAISDGTSATVSVSGDGLTLNGQSVEAEAA